MYCQLRLRWCQVFSLFWCLVRPSIASTTFAGADLAGDTVRGDTTTGASTAIVSATVAGGHQR
jgi:hypothetical protein